MLLDFYKYHGNGNDFIIMDNRRNFFPVNDHALVKALCNRNFGIGADGLMLLNEKEGYDFHMIYFNSDGREGSLCGNGGRCMVHFARELGLIDRSAIFSGADGPHMAKIDGDVVELKMQDVPKIERDGAAYIINTGSPHYIEFVDDVEDTDVLKKGREIRYSDKYMASGINVNFVQDGKERIRVRTYERGVENETLACGTGSVAAVLSAALEGKISGNSAQIETRGGLLDVSFRRDDNNSFTDIWLKGPAKLVFHGTTDTRNLGLE
jgi:diaminopimelate epimerase